MEFKGVIIQASSRSNGNTASIVKLIQKHTGYDVINLNEYNIGHFDYDFKNDADDFNQLFKEIVSKYETIVMATPVYWYSMSGILKVFLDRISDFLKKETAYGRKLRGKNLAVISCCSSKEYFKDFEVPFIKSADYLGMKYLGYIHTWVLEEGIDKEVTEKCNVFAKRINKPLNSLN